MRLRRNTFPVPVPDPFTLNSKIPFCPGESDFCPEMSDFFRDESSFFPEKSGFFPTKVRPFPEKVHDTLNFHDGKSRPRVGSAIQDNGN